MAQTIKLKRSALQGVIPTTSQLELGEVAINTYDGKVYIKKNVGGTESIVEVGSTATFLPAGSDGQLQFNNGGALGATAQAYYDDVNNRLGLGTSSPLTTFHVNGTATFESYIDFLSPDTTNTISVSMLDTDTLSFSGDSGQLFSITDSLSGTIFAVNDISGVPSIEVDDDGTIRLAETFGNVLIGTDVDDGVNKLQLDGKFSFLLDTSAGNRYFKSYGSSGVRLQRAGDTIGWAFAYGFLSNNGADHGGFGGFGDDTSLTYYYIGTNYSDSSNFRFYKNGSLRIGSTEILDTSRNLLNIGTITATGGTMTGNLVLNADLVFGNSRIYASGDTNHIHVNCPTALIPEGTTTSSNTGLGTSSYRWKDFYSGPIDVGNITTSGYLRGPANFVIDPAAHGDNTGTVVIAGNLQVDGTTTTINSTTVQVDDKNIELAVGSTNKAAADGAGITIDCGTDADATILYDGANDEWDFNKTLKVSGSIGVTNIVTNRIIKFNGTVLDDSIMYDTGTYVGVNTTTPTAKLHVVDGGTSTETTFSANNRIKMRGDGVLTWGASADQGRLTWNTGYASILGLSGNALYFGSDGSQGRIVLDTAGSFNIGSATAFTTGGTAKTTILSSSVALSFGASNTDMSYIRRQNSGEYCWQTFNGGNSGNIELQPYGGSVSIGTTINAGRLHIVGAASDQTASPDSPTLPDTSTLAAVVIDGSYTDGKYRTRFAKIDRSGNLPLYIQESRGTANSYLNVARFGSFGQSVHEFEVFGSAKVDYLQTGIGTIISVNSDSWTYTPHDIVYNGWRASTGDYTYLKAAGNSGTAHGIAVVADNAFYVGVTDQETGALADNATNPITTTWAKISADGIQTNGNINVNSTFALNGQEATLATTTQTQIASFSATTYGGGKFVITAKDGVNRHICELLVTHDGTTAVATQYGSVTTASDLATYDVDISGGNVRILATSASANSTEYKVAETLMEA